METSSDPTCVYTVAYQGGQGGIKPQTKNSSSNQGGQGGIKPQNNPFFKIFGIAGIGGSSLVILSLLKQLQKLVGDPKKELTHYLNSPNGCDLHMIASQIRKILA